MYADYKRTEGKKKWTIPMCRYPWANCIPTIITAICAIWFATCDGDQPPRHAQSMNHIAEGYVKLVLKIGLYDSDYVDAYYGPAAWRPAETNKKDKFPYQDLHQQVTILRKKLNEIEVTSLKDLQKQRHTWLNTQLRAVQAKIEMLHGKKFTFDEESALLYDAVAPPHDEAYFQKLIRKLDTVLPGNGNVTNRLTSYRKKFNVPMEKVDDVFRAAIAECRRRTVQYIDLPKRENFTVEYVSHQPWGAYNWYKGNSISLIQINTDLPMQISSAIGRAAHEGYPGHHVFSVLLEENLSLKRGWVEFYVYALFSPQSLIAEGSANYGEQFLFPRDERIKFEQEVLYPLAGLDKNKAEEYFQIMELVDALTYARNEAARNYLDGKFIMQETVDWLIRYSLMDPKRARKYVSFIEKYRSYVINYNLGQDIVKTYIESNGGTDNNPDKRWKLFTKIISTPVTPSMLVNASQKIK
jgi:hypothetical protein